MTASVLKQDPNTLKVQKNPIILLGQKHNLQIFGTWFFNFLNSSTPKQVSDLTFCFIFPCLTVV